MRESVDDAYDRERQEKVDCAALPGEPGWEHDCTVERVRLKTRLGLICPWCGMQPNGRFTE